MNFKIIIPFIIGIIICFIPIPVGLKDPNAWYLFAIFFSAIIAVIINAMSIFTASLVAVGIAIVTKTLPVSIAFHGFGASFILLIVSAFILSTAFIKSGLGNRIALIMISKFGKTTLGLTYSLMVTDLIIAPAFPSNTARSGVLFPLYKSLALHNESDPQNGTEGKIGTYLMMIGITSLSISSALWLTAMAANPAAADLAQGIIDKAGGQTFQVNFFTWFITASVPCIAAVIIVPYIMYKVINPEIKHTPEAPQKAKEDLKKMGKMSLNEKIVGTVFLVMVILWATSGMVPKEYSAFFEKTAIAMLGLAILIVSRVFSVNDIKETGGSALEIFFWFAILYSLSSALAKLGFMSWLGAGIASYLDGISPFLVYIILVIVYVLIHYFFVSQSAQAMTLIPIFLSIAVSLHVNMVLMTFMLLFATNFFAGLTPQASSANVVFLSDGYINFKKFYYYGAILTLACFVVFMVVGTPWISLLTYLGLYY